MSDKQALRGNGPRPVPGVLALSPYQQGASRIAGRAPRCKLSANESALGTPPAARAAYAALAAHLHRYPDGSQAALREALADVHALEAERIVCGNGSEELLGLLIRCYLGPGEELLLSENHFGVCRLYALAVGGRIVIVPERDFVVDVDALLAAVTPRTRLVIIANPNNPTGTCLPAGDIHRLHAGLPPEVLLILDGAYAEFVTMPDYTAGEELVRAHGNVVMTRSFSKAWGLAGLRIGWCYAPPAIVDIVQRLRVPFNANAAAMAAAAAALRDAEWLPRVREHNAGWLRRIRSELEALGLRVLPSEANFYLLVFDGLAGKTAAGAAAALEAAGIIPRPVSAGGDHDVLRISVGSDEENAAVLAVLRRYLTG